MSTAIELRKVTKSYKTGKLSVEALCGVDVKIQKGEMVAIMGPSGSGKSTLMHIIGLLDRPTTGDLYIDGKKVDLKMPDAKLAKLRSEKIGFVFQTFNLLSKLTALDNVLMPTQYHRTGKSNRQTRAMEILSEVGLSGREKHRPTELSGGQIQRVAIARSLINNPDIILADEPTGNLDSKSGTEIMKVLTDLNKKGKTVILITHDQRIADFASRTIHILDGRVEKPSTQKVTNGQEGGK
jgi:putative ABC transport system ATP-binding protein